MSEDQGGRQSVSHDLEPRGALPTNDHEDFTCAICQRRIEMRWNFGRSDAILPPICLSCERLYTEGVRAPSAGAFRDRRNAVRILALAEAINSEVGRQQWEARHGR